MKVIFNVIVITAISVFALLIQAASLQAQTPAVNGNGHKIAVKAVNQGKQNKLTGPASSANASTPAATGSGPSSSDIHTRAAASSGKQTKVANTATVKSSKPASSQANLPNATGGRSSKQPRVIKTVPPPAATGSGPSSSDIHTNAKPSTVPSAKVKPTKKKHKTGNS